MKTKSQSWALIALLLTAGLLGLLLLPGETALAAATWYVAPGGADSDDCLSPDTPCKTIAAAIGKASAGDTVSVLPGTYSTASGEVFPILMKPGIQLAGTDPETAIIDGEAGNPVLYIGGETLDFGSDTQVSQLTLQHGSIGIQIYSTDYHSASPTLDDLKIRWNTLGIQMSTVKDYNYGATIAPDIGDTLIVSNTQSGIYIHAYGYFTPAHIDPHIHDTTIRGNGLYGINAYAAAPSSNQTTAAPHITDTTITGNGSHGVYIQSEYQGHSEPIVEQSVISGNAGFGFYYEQTWNSGVFTGIITNTAITSNTAGGVYVSRCVSGIDPGSITIASSTIANNGEYGIYWVRDGYGQDVIPSVVNTILWNPLALNLYSTGEPWTSAYVSYSDILGNTFSGENGNFSADPLLWDDYHLSSCSPAIDQATSAGAPAVDIDGDARPIGAGPDVGADEVQKNCLLALSQQVSKSQAQFGEVLAFEFEITPDQLSSPHSLLLTDTLPAELSLVQASLWASDGEISSTEGEIGWTGSLSPGNPISLGFEAEIVEGDTTLQNYARVSAGQDGRYASPRVNITSGPAFSYIPMLIKAPPSKGIYGKVTYNGGPVGYQYLDLRFYDGYTWYTRASTYTDNQGGYSFLNVPALAPGQYYYVLYSNPGYDPSRLWLWGTRLISTYYTNQEIPAGDFDIANIDLLSPGDEAGMGFPATFYWKPRPATPTDSYEFNLYGYQNNPYFYTDPPLGYTGSYTLYSLPPGFEIYTWYVWEIWVYSPDGGYGISYDYRFVYFYASGTSAIPEAPPPTLRSAPDLPGHVR